MGRAGSAGIAIALVVAACGSEARVLDGGGGGRDTGRARDAGVASALDGGTPGADAGSTSDGGAADPDGGAPPLSRDVRFVVMGDTGEGNAAQGEVAAAVASTCAAEGCDFVLLLGDNIYNSGVDSVEDPQWQSKFEEPYRDIELPFYAVLGNHDYGGTLYGVSLGGLGNEWDKGPIEVAYTDHSEKWTMPATHYTLQMGHVGFVMLDTNSILWDEVTHGDQRAWFATAVDDLRSSGAEWIIAAGHHPYLSNGRHGNAGSYESIEVGGTELPNPLPILNGANVKSFFEDLACGVIDVYFAGHDHNQQWIDQPEALCGAELIVSGAGAKLTSLASTLNPVHFEDDMREGFMYVRIEGDAFYGRFVDRHGATMYERMAVRRGTSP